MKDNTDKNIKGEAVCSGNFPKTGLVLEGGAMRGMFTAGVLDVFMENEIYTDGVVGVSAGAVFGCNYKSRQIGRTIRYNKRFAGDWRYCSIRSLLKTGDLYGADFCYNRIPNELDVFDLESYKKIRFLFMLRQVIAGLENVFTKNWKLAMKTTLNGCVRALRCLLRAGLSRLTDINCLTVA